MPRPSIVDLQVDSLQERLVTAEDSKKEERFLWFSFSGALFVVLAFVAGGTVAGLALTVIYVAFLLILSKRWGFEAFWEALYAAHSMFARNKPPEPNDDD